MPVSITDQSPQAVMQMRTVNPQVVVTRSQAPCLILADPASSRVVVMTVGRMPGMVVRPMRVTTTMRRPASRVMGWSAMAAPGAVIFPRVRATVLGLGSIDRLKQGLLPWGLSLCDPDQGRCSTGGEEQERESVHGDSPVIRES